MTHIKVLTFTLLAAMARCEPPVQGYNYRRPSYQNSYNAPVNQYIPPSTDYAAPPSNSYLPAPSFGHSGNQYSGQSNQYSGQSNQYSGQSNQYSGQDSYDHDHGHDHGHENEVPKSYEFGYSVKDAQSGNDYDRHETSDGNTVRGEYRVQLPDGRTQIVTYHADWKTGFHADVRYEGEAHYPEPTPSANLQAGYNYNAPSDFSGSLTGFQGNRNTYRPSTAYGPPGYH